MGFRQPFNGSPSILDTSVFSGFSSTLRPEDVGPVQVQAENFSSETLNCLLNADRDLDSNIHTEVELQSNSTEPILTGPDQSENFPTCVDYMETQDCRDYNTQTNDTNLDDPLAHDITNHLVADSNSVTQPNTLLQPNNAAVEEEYTSSRINLGEPKRPIPADTILHAPLDKKVFTILLDGPPPLDPQFIEGCGLKIEIPDDPASSNDFDQAVEKLKLFRPAILNWKSDDCPIKFVYEKEFIMSDSGINQEGLIKSNIHHFNSIFPA